MALKKCKECGEEISKKATECPKCGSPQKKKTSFLTWVITIIIAFFIYVYYVGEKSNYEKEVQIDSQTPTQEIYKKEGKKLAYRDASLEKYNDLELLVFTGRISQLLSDSKGVMFTKENLLGYREDQIILSFSEKPYLIVDDIVKIYGRYRGAKETETIFGEDKKVPFVKVDHYFLVKKKN